MSLPISNLVYHKPRGLDDSPRSDNDDSDSNTAATGRYHYSNNNNHEQEEEEDVLDIRRALLGGGQQGRGGGVVAGITTRRGQRLRRQQQQQQQQVLNNNNNNRKSSRTTTTTAGGVGGSSNTTDHPSSSVTPRILFGRAAANPGILVNLSKSYPIRSLHVWDVRLPPARKISKFGSGMIGNHNHNNHHHSNHHHHHHHQPRAVLSSVNRVRFWVQRQRKVTIETRRPLRKQQHNNNKSGGGGTSTTTSGAAVSSLSGHSNINRSSHGGESVTDISVVSSVIDRPTHQDVMERLLQGSATNGEFAPRLGDQELGDHDIVLFRILQPADPTETVDEYKGATTTSTSGGGAHDDDCFSAISTSTFGVGDDDGEIELMGWAQHSVYRLDQVEVLKCFGRVCEVRLGLKGGKHLSFDNIVENGFLDETVIRMIKFESEEDAMQFQDILEKMIDKMKTRDIRVANAKKVKAKAKAAAAAAAKKKAAEEEEEEFVFPATAAAVSKTEEEEEATNKETTTDAVLPEVMLSSDAGGSSRDNDDNDDDEATTTSAEDDNDDDDDDDVFLNTVGPQLSMDVSLKTIKLATNIESDSESIAEFSIISNSTSFDNNNNDNCNEKKIVMKSSSSSSSSHHHQSEQQQQGDERIDVVKQETSLLLGGTKSDKSVVVVVAGPDDEISQDEKSRLLQFNNKKENIEDIESEAEKNSSPPGDKNSSAAHAEKVVENDDENDNDNKCQQQSKDNVEVEQIEAQESRSLSMEKSDEKSINERDDDDVVVRYPQSKEEEDVDVRKDMKPEDNPLLGEVDANSGTNEGVEEVTCQQSNDDKVMKAEKFPLEEATTENSVAASNVADDDDDMCLQSRDIEENSLGAERGEKFDGAFIDNNNICIFDSKVDRRGRNADLEAGQVDMITAVIEIVGAVGPCFSDQNAYSDTFVVVTVGQRHEKEEIHRTGIIRNIVDPIWTLESGSLFMLRKMKSEFVKSQAGNNNNNIIFTIHARDFNGYDQILGNVTFPIWKLLKLLKRTGERLYWDILPEKTKEGSKNKNSNNINNVMVGKLYLRFKEANENEIRFLERFHTETKRYGVYAGSTSGTGQPLNVDRHNINNSNETDDNDGVETATRPLNEGLVEDECFKESSGWVETGSGDLGKLYLEIIKCDNLIGRKGRGTTGGEKIGAFACAVFEDNIVRTDVIGETKSPRWMPWCRRAFAFNVAHPSSNLFLGIFEKSYFSSPGGTASGSAPIGRICLGPLSNFAFDTTYDLTYPLHNDYVGAHDGTDNRGTVTLRLRLAFSKRRRTFLRALASPPVHDVSDVNFDDHRVSCYTTEGSDSSESFSMKAIAEYIKELNSYLVAGSYIQEALLAVWLWRGQYQPKAFGFIPQHSAAAFIWGVLVTWNFNFLPSFVFFGVGWILLACNAQARRHPSELHKCKRYDVMLLEFLSNWAPRKTIDPNENLRESEAHEKVRREWYDEGNKKNGLKAGGEKEFDVHIWEGIDDGDFQGIESPSDSSLEVLQPAIISLHNALTQLALRIRNIKSICLWENSHSAFWITSFSFALAIAVAFVPWGFFFRWTLRVIAWTVLGPWMAIVDRCFVRTSCLVPRASKERARRIHAERDVKTRSMRKYIFGKYILQVPVSSSRVSKPLFQSSAKPYEKQTAPARRVIERRSGQHLEGDMIPKFGGWESALATNISASAEMWSKTVDSISTSSRDDEATPLIEHGTDELPYQAMG